jgi:hypothetical protein
MLIDLRDYPFQLTIRRVVKVGDLLRSTVDFLIDKDLCGIVKVDTEEREAIDFERAYRITEIPPDPSRSEQLLHLWTINGTVDFGSITVLGKEEGDVWGMLRLISDSKLGERGDYRYYIGQREVQFGDLPTDPVAIVPMEIPTPDRGCDADSTSMLGQRGPRQDGRYSRGNMNQSQKSSRSKS